MAREIKATIALDGAAKFRSELKDAESGLKVLQAQMKTETREFERNGQEMEKNAAKAKNYAKQIEQQKVIVKALEGALKDSAKKYGENSKATDAWKVQLAKAQDALNTMTHAQEDAAKAADDLANGMKEAGKAADEMADSWNKAKDSMGNGFGNALSGIGSAATKAGTVVVGAVGTITAAAAAGIKSIIELEVEAANAADNLLTQSVVNGIDTQTLQRWAYAADKTDVSVDTLISSKNKLTAAMRTTAGQEAIGKTGVHYDPHQDPMDLFWDIMDATARKGNSFGKEENIVEIDEVFSTLFGKSWRDFRPLLVDHDGMTPSEWYKSIADQADEHGVVQSDETLDALGHLSEVFGDIEANKQGIKNALAEYFVGPMTDLAEAAERVSGVFAKWLKGDADTDDLVTEMENTINNLLGDDGVLAKGKEKLDELIAGLQGSENGYVSALGDAMKGIENVFQWMIDNKDTVVNTMKAIFAVWATAKVAGWVNTIGTTLGGIMNKFKGVTGGGTGGTPTVVPTGTGGTPAAGTPSTPSTPATPTAVIPAATGAAAKLTGASAALDASLAGTASGAIGSTVAAGFPLVALGLSLPVIPYTIEEMNRMKEDGTLDKIVEETKKRMTPEGAKETVEEIQSTDARKALSGLWSLITTGDTGGITDAAETARERRKQREELREQIRQENEQEYLSYYADQAANGGVFEMMNARDYLFDNAQFKEKFLEAMPGYKDIIEWLYSDASADSDEWGDMEARLPGFFQDIYNLVNGMELSGASDEKPTEADPLPVTIVDPVKDNTPDLATNAPTSVVDFTGEQQALAWKWYSEEAGTAAKDEAFRALQEAVGDFRASMFSNILDGLNGPLDMTGFSQLFTTPDLPALENIESTVSDASINAMASKIAASCKTAIESAHITAVVNGNQIAGFVSSYFGDNIRLGGVVL